jgi:hypothetical protein
MRYFFELHLLPEGIHDFGELHDIPIIFSKILLQEKKDE